MNTMKGLIIKDLQNIKSYRKNLILFTILFAILGYFNENFSMLSIYITICFGMMSVNSFYYDGASNAERYLLATTVNKKDMVKEKYIYSFLCTVVGAILGIVLSMILQAIKGDLGGDIMESIISTAIGGLFAMLFLEIFQIPVLYKFGYEKGRYVQIVIIMMVVLAFSAFYVGIADTMNLEENMRKIVEILEEYGIYIFGGITILFYLISYKISYCIYQKKEV